MSKYRITLEGKTYEMEVELLSENGAPQPAVKKEQKESAQAPAVRAAAPAAQPKQAAPAANSGVMAAPMPGTVLRIEKKAGDAVKAGELVLILEAMKMENEILAPVSGTIAVMNCTPGGTVAGGEVLFEIK